MALLAVNNLSVQFQTSDGVVNAVNDLSFSIEPGRTTAIVGESGSGKSQTAFAILGLLAQNGSASGSVSFGGNEILNAPEAQLNRLRAAQLAIIFQDPMTSLNPYMRIGDQMSEVLVHHSGLTKAEAQRQAIAMLDAVEIPDAKSRAHLFPHEFSGGMRQRVMIAMSLLCKPKLLIADEPTTALDVTVQAQIMALFKSLQKELGMAVILITHDLGVVAGFCQDVLVLYGGRMMERGPVDPIFETPSHPYTRGLLKAIPRLDGKAGKLDAIPGNPPNMMFAPKGCPFAPRCAHAIGDCTDHLKPLHEFAPQRWRACNLTREELA